VRSGHYLCGRGIHPHKYGMEVMSHHDPISYGKFVLAFIYLFWFLLFHFLMIFSFWYFLFPYMSFYFLIYLFSFLAFLIFSFWYFPCRYNQVDKHLKNKALKCIISRKLKGNYLLHYDMKLLRRKKMPLIKQRFFFFFSS